MGITQYVDKAASESRSEKDKKGVGPETTI